MAPGQWRIHCLGVFFMQKNRDKWDRLQKAGLGFVLPAAILVLLGVWAFEQAEGLRDRERIGAVAEEGLTSQETAGGLEAAGELSAQESWKVPAAPRISADHAIVMERSAGAVLYEKGAYDRAYPASTTKILTTLLAVESGRLSEVTVVSDFAAGQEGSSIYAEPGEEITLRDLCYGMMLRSGNDAAVAAAEFLAGDADAFAVQMNRRAEELGAVDTHFTNPSGLYDEDHYTTAYDLAVISRAAMELPEFRAMAGAKTWTTGEGTEVKRTFANKNKVLQQYKGGTGIKIGYTTATGRTLVASSEREGMEVICVVLNDSNWFGDSYALMDWAFENFALKQVLRDGQILQEVPLSGGMKETVKVGVKEGFWYPAERSGTGEGTKTGGVRKEDDENGAAGVVWEVMMEGDVQAPVSRWQEAGEVNLYKDGQLVGSRVLYFLEDCPAGK